MVDRELKLRKREFGVVRNVTNATWYNQDLKLFWHLIIKKYSSQAKKLEYTLEFYWKLLLGSYMT